MGAGITGAGAAGIGATGVTGAIGLTLAPGIDDIGAEAGAGAAGGGVAPIGPGVGTAFGDQLVVTG